MTFLNLYDEFVALVIAEEVLNCLDKDWRKERFLTLIL